MYILQNLYTYKNNRLNYLLLIVSFEQKMSIWSKQKSTVRTNHDQRVYVKNGRSIRNCNELNDNFATGNIINVGGEAMSINFLSLKKKR